LGKILVDNKEDKEEIMEQLVKVRQQLQYIQAHIGNQECHEEDQKANSPRPPNQDRHERAGGLVPN
jgi:hypothetical protein